MDKTLRELIEIIHFTENVSAKIHGLLDEAEIYRTVKEQFARSERYTASILLLTDDESSLGIAETSMASEKLKAGEETAGVPLKGYRLDLNKSSIFSQVVRERITLQVNVSDVIDQLLPRPVAYLVSKVMDYEKKPSILTPLKRHGKVIGVLGVSSIELAEHFVPSVRNLAQHISTALELADEHAERKRAEEELREYRDHLEELVEERTAELKLSNEQLHREITERKRAEAEIRRRTAHLEALRQVGLEITAELDLDSLLHSIVSQAVELAGGTAGGLYLYRPDLDALMWVMAVGPNLAPIGTVLQRGEGLSGTVWETGEPLIVDDYQQWEGRGAVYEDYPWTAVVGVPVRWREKFLGVLNVLTDAPSTFSPLDAELLSLLATQAAIAIRNACLFEGEQEQRDLAEALVEAAAVVSSTLDPDEVLDRILEEVSRVVPNDAANIMLVEGDEAHIARWRGYESFGAEEFVSTVVFRIPEVLNLREMVESREPIVIPDTAVYPGWVEVPVQEWLRSYAAAPIIVRGEVIGFLNVDSATLGFFTQDHAESLRAFADHAATAIENARLYTIQQQLAQEKGNLLDIAKAITSTLDLTEVLRLVSQRAAHACGADRCTILLLDDEGKTLTPAMSQFAAGSMDKEMWQLFKDTLYPRPLADVPEAQQVLREGRPLFIPEAITSSLPRYWVEPFNVKSLLVVPMISKGQPIGVIGLDHMEEDKGFSAEQVNLAMTIGAQAAIAIENAWLYQEAQQELAERQRVQEALRESEEKHRTLVEQSLQGIVVAQGPPPRLVFANPVMAEISGYTVEELTSLSPQETEALIHPEDRALFFGRFADRLAGKPAPSRYEVRGIHRDGTVRWLEISASRIEYQGQPAIQATFVDITERRRAEEALERRAAQLATVSEIGRQILSILDPDELLRQIVNSLEEAFGYRYVYILLLDEDSNELVARAGAGAGRVLEGTRIPLAARSINAHVARTGETLLVNDVSQEALYLLMEEIADTKSELCVPVEVKGQVIGTLDVQSAELHAFDESDLSTLQTLAHQAAIAIENARLYEEAQRRIAELAGLHELSQAFSCVTDVRETYGELTKRMAELIGCQACTVATYDPQTREMGAQPPGYGATDEVVQSFCYKVDGPARDAWNFRLQGPLLANDTVQIPGFFSQWVEGFNLFNLLIVPMTLEGKITGLVYAANKPGGFAEGDSKLLTIFAGQAAVIIENARLYEESRHRLDELSTIHEVSVAATSTMDLDQALERAVNAMQRVLDFQVFGFLLLDESTGELHLHPSYRGIDPETVDKLDLRLGRGITGWVAQTGKPLRVPDVSRDPRYLSAMTEIRSEMCVPLKIGERVVGVIDVESDRVNAFSEDDLRLLSTLAGQLATIIENAHLFAETEGKANDLALLLDTSTAISSTLDLDQILETVAHQITTSLVATLCRITLLDETGENLIIRAASPIRDKMAEDGFGRRYPLAMAPWHRQVVETSKPVILRQDMLARALSGEERRMALTEEVKSAALIPLIVGGRVLGVISLGEERSWERSPFTHDKVELCQSIASQAAVAIENARLYEELQQSFLQTIAALAAAVEAKDPYTGGHSQRTTELAAGIAQKLGLGDEDIKLIRYASLLHDVGKIGISEQILSKPGSLNEEEWEEIHKHPALGANIVERAASLQKLVPIILHHHEHYDGQGYPDGLRGEDIPLKARILSVADAFEAMTSDRAYRPAMTVEQALSTLREGADKQWDGELVAVLHRIIRKQGEQGHHGEQDQPLNASG